MPADAPATPALPRGPFSRADALAAGRTVRSVRTKLDAGSWQRLRRGAYVDRDILQAAEAQPDRLHAMAVRACLLHVPDAAASGSSAARLHGLPLLSPASPEVALTRIGRGSPTSYPGLRIRVASLPAEHVTRRYDVPVTTTARTVVDLGRGLPWAQAVTVTDAALHSRSTTTPELAAVLSDCAGWPGVRAAARVISFADAATESPLESLARVLFARHGFEPPVTQPWLGDEHGPIGRVDFCWPDHRTIAEADGLVKYADERALRAEKLRQERLEQAGFVVVRLTWSDVTRFPDRSSARLRAAFARGALLQRADRSTSRGG